MIELKPHIGIDTCTRETVDIGQDRIFVDGKCVGYVGRKPNAPINLITACDDVTAANIADCVRKKNGGWAAKISTVPELPEDELDEDELVDEDLFPDD